MVATLGMKYNAETMLEVLRGLVLHFDLYFVSYDKVPFICYFSTVQHHFLSTRC